MCARTRVHLICRSRERGGDTETATVSTPAGGYLVPPLRARPGPHRIVVQRGKSTPPPRTWEAGSEPGYYVKDGGTPHRYHPPSSVSDPNRSLQGAVGSRLQTSSDSESRAPQAGPAHVPLQDGRTRSQAGFPSAPITHVMDEGSTMV